MVARRGFEYLGQALSSADIFAAMFGSGFVQLGHDRFILSPGHYGISFYAVAAGGFLERDALGEYGEDEALLEVPRNERRFSISPAARRQGSQGRSAKRQGCDEGDDRRMLLLSDGEMEEGQVWEGAMFAAHRKLSNLTVIVDANDSQVDGPVSSVTTIEPLDAKWAAAGWQVTKVDGHDIQALMDALWSLRTERHA